MAVDFKTIPNNNITVSTTRWAGLSMAENEGKPLDVSGLENPSIQLDGDFDELTKVVVLGSNDGKGFYPVTDKQGNVLRVRKAGIFSIGDNVAFIKPVVEDGGESTLVNATLNARSIA